MDFKTAIVTIADSAQAKGRSGTNEYSSILKKKKGEVYEFIETLSTGRRMDLLDAVERRVG